MHAFCIYCIHKWSNFKRKCPLCNAEFDSWFFKISLSARTFHKEKLLALNEGKKADIGQRYRIPEQRIPRVIRRLREELNTVSQQTRPLPRRRSFGQSRSMPPGSFAERVLQWRASIYEQHLRAVPFSSRNRPVQHIRGNDGVKDRIQQRIEPWIRRELQALLGDPDPSVILHVAASLFISSLEERHSVSSGQSDVEDNFLAPLRRFLHEWTDTFWHELRCFAESPFNMETYDTIVEYKWVLFLSKVANKREFGCASLLGLTAERILELATWTKCTRSQFLTEFRGSWTERIEGESSVLIQSEDKKEAKRMFFSIRGFLTVIFNDTLNTGQQSGKSCILQEELQSRGPNDLGFLILARCSGFMREEWRLYRMSGSFAAIIGGAGAVLAVLALVIGFVWFCMLQRRSSSNKNSETGSSDPSAVVELKRGGPSSSSAPALSEPHGTRQFTMEELEQATKHFTESNLIGYGSFGLVYKGLLRDGTVVAIKRRTGIPRQELVEEVVHLSGIWHRNLVTLLGYCQERGYQMLVFEHLPNGSMCNHLYDTGKDPTTKLEFKQRLSIALGAAKGLCHLHSQKPPIVHSNFKTANVLVDENFIAKVADAGVTKLLQRIEDASTSHMTSSNVFQDPEVGPMGIFSEMSDVYSFGVFLLELVTGRAASNIDSFRYHESILQWVQTHLSGNNFVDHRLAGSFTAEGMNDFIGLILQCLSYPRKQRPKMDMVVLEIDRIREKEITLTTVMGEGTATVILGSQLFTSK
ncbi:hypothetical protein F0562_000229 [Nyssa sinensis]|uniref:non-specific serine/threonine protein kinase n=1 Tax=Nyssa sinensis TaxID=561372 RepID=A0A5J5C0X0_9ASTE|nr:hypothetical protein F0562_000229 [Nyssa sinensis]